MGRAELSNGQLYLKIIVSGLCRGIEFENIRLHSFANQTDCPLWIIAIGVVLLPTLKRTLITIENDFYYSVVVGNQKKSVYRQ